MQRWTSNDVPTVPRRAGWWIAALGAVVVWAMSSAPERAPGGGEPGKSRPPTARPEPAHRGTMADRRPSTPPNAEIAPLPAAHGRHPTAGLPTASPDLPAGDRGWAGLTTVPGELLVTLRSPSDVPALRDAAAAWGLEVAAASSALPAARVRLVAGQDPVEIARRLAGLPQVLESAPHAVTHGAAAKNAVCGPAGAWILEKGSGDGARLRARAATCDGACAECKAYGPHEEAPLGALQWSLGCIDIDEITPKGASGRGVVVALLDTGVAYRSAVVDGVVHEQAPDLSHVPFVAPYDFVQGDDGADDDNGHGTLMASILAGFGGAWSVAPNVTIMPIKVLDAGNAGTELELVEGLHWAVDHGADVVSLSLALPLDYAPSALLQEALGRALASGAVVVAAAGNEGAADVAWPAAYPGAVAVGASEYAAAGACKGAAVSGYSNRSPRLDVALPAGTHGADSDGDGYPDAALGMSFPPGDPTAFGYWFVSGTSPAAAMASGVAALLIEGGLDGASVPAALQASTGAWSEKPDGATAAADRTLSVAIEGGRLRARIGHSKHPCGAALPAYANPVGVLESAGDPAAGLVRARFAVEILDQELQPLKDAVVFAQIGGDQRTWATAETGKDGIAVLVTEPVEPDAAADGVLLTLRVEGVASKKCGGYLARPTLFTRVDEASYLLLSSLHAGGSARAVLLAVDPAVGATLPGAAPESTLPTYVHRALGVGMATTSFVALLDDTALDLSGQRTISAIFRTFGVGMATTSIVVDPAFFAPERLAATAPLLVLSRTAGTGMATTSIVRGDAWVTEQELTSALGVDPALLRLTVGDGQESTVVVQDRSLLHPSLDGALPGGTAGVGMATTSLVSALSTAVLTDLWSAWKTPAGPLGGAGMATTSLVGRQSPSLLVGLWPLPGATLSSTFGTGATTTRLEDY